MAFDEIYGHAGVRPLYKTALDPLSRLTPERRRRIHARAEKLFDGDNILPPLPRLISKFDYLLMTEGVRQRGRALQRFLTDHYCGLQTYKRSGILKSSHLDEILKRYPVLHRQVPVRPENIQFWYAPDIIRGDDGSFRVIEDNIGFVGGFGDLIALASATELFGVAASATRQANKFYREMISGYKAEAQRCGGGQTILVSYPKSERPNHEDGRIEKIFAGFGVASITDANQLKIRSGEVFYRSERVGFVIVNVKPEDIESADCSNDVSPFWHAVSRRKVGVSYAPGLAFVGDKMFYPSVDRLVRFYLKQDCLLPSLPTLDFKNRKNLIRVFDERDDWVIKTGRGQGGDGVWVGRHLSGLEWRALFNRVKANPCNYMAQKYCEPSQFLNRDVDFRPLAVIAKSKVLVSPFPWGRAAGGRDRKTNITGGGLPTPIAVIDL